MTVIEAFSLGKPVIATDIAKFERQVLFQQHDHCAHHAGSLRCQCGNGCTGGIQMQPGHQKQIAENIHDAGYKHKQQGRLAVAQAAENRGQQVIGHDKKDAGTADADITGSQAEGFFRGLHQDGNGPRKPDQHNEQHSRDQREYNNRAADDLPDVLRPLFAQIPGDEHGDVHCKLCYHEGDKVQHLAAGGHGRKARG